MFNLERERAQGNHSVRNRFAGSPQRSRQPNRSLQNRPLPENWIRSVSSTIEPGRVYYINGLTRESQWDFPDHPHADGGGGLHPQHAVEHGVGEQPEEEERRRRYQERADEVFRIAEAERQAHIQRLDAERQARIQRTRAERQAERQARLEEEEEDRLKLEQVNSDLEITNSFRIAHNQRPLFRNQDGVIGLIRNNVFEPYDPHHRIFY